MVQKKINAFLCNLANMWLILYCCKNAMLPLLQSKPFFLLRPFEITKMIRRTVFSNSLYDATQVFAMLHINLASSNRADAVHREIDIKFTELIRWLKINVITKS